MLLKIEVLCLLYALCKSLFRSMLTLVIFSPRFSLVSDLPSGNIYFPLSDMPFSCSISEWSAAGQILAAYILFQRLFHCAFNYVFSCIFLNPLKIPMDLSLLTLHGIYYAF